VLGYTALELGLGTAVMTVMAVVGPAGGRIVNISSAVTRIASPFVHYAMRKGAIEVLGHTLAQQLGPRGITVNSVKPGVVETDMGLLGRQRSWGARGCGFDRSPRTAGEADRRR
jgi:3-oxoacyl-[acyl-carrier protein] reductase